MIKRSHELLRVDPAARERADLYNRVLYTQDASMSDRVNYRIYTRFLKEKELQTAVMQMVKDNVPKASSKEKTDQDPDFASLLKQSIKDGEAQNQGNPFYMDDSSYKWKVRPFMKKKKNQSLNGSYSTSPEYDDLRCFLDVCQDLGIRPLLVMMPVNGYWYDYTGFPKEAREDYYQKIRSVAAEYNASIADFSDQEYTKYFFEDGVHIGKKGWVMINESIYRFYQKTEEK